MTITFEISPHLVLVGDAEGDPNKQPVIFLHGGGQTRHSWGDTARVIAQQGYYTLCLDARGHGDSSWSPEVAYKVEDLAQDLLAIIARFEQKPVLVGASMGGLTAMIAQGEAAFSIAKAIVLVDIAPKAEQKGIERIFAFMSANMNEGFASLEDAAASVAAYLPNREKPSDHSRLEKNLRLRNGRYYWHWDPAMLRLWKDWSKDPANQIAYEERLFKAARNLSVPTLIVRGGISDVVSERVMTEFLDEVPQAQSITVAGAGHMVAGDSNHAFTNAVLAFLNGL